MLWGPGFCADSRPLRSIVKSVESAYRRKMTDLHEIARSTERLMKLPLRGGRRVLTVMGGGECAGERVLIQATSDAEWPQTHARNTLFEAISSFLSVS